jgi:acetyl esterase/lipase
MSQPTTIEIKNPDQHKIFIDLHCTGHHSNGCLLFMHGGALLIGSRKDMPQAVINFINSLGWDVACGEYRLIPKYQIEEIVSDVLACSIALRDRYPDKPLVLSGYSAGAYLSLLAGALNAPVDGLLPFAGYGDLLGDWCTTPSQFFKEYKNVDYCEEWIKERRPFVSVGERIDLYVYLRQKGTWAEYVLGHDSSEERAERLSPKSVLTLSFPDVVLIHGTEDLDVPSKASRDMANALDAKGLKNTLVELTGMDHDLYTKVSEVAIKQAWKEALEYFSNSIIFSENLRSSCRYEMKSSVVTSKR